MNEGFYQELSMEINPENPLVDQWFPLAAVILYISGAGKTEVDRDGKRSMVLEITPEQIERFRGSFGGETPCMVLEEKGKNLLVRLEGELAATARMEKYEASKKAN